MDGPLEGVTLCHCIECRRWHGHICAMTAAKNDRLRFVSDSGLRWIDSPESDAHARRGFCAECGSSLFWDPPGDEWISIAAGALDPPTRLRIESQVYVSSASDYYEVDRAVPEK